MSKRDFIDETEFNRLTFRQGPALPWRDSAGDSASDELVETEMGEDYVEDEGGEEGEGLEGADEEELRPAIGFGDGSREDGTSEESGIIHSERDYPLADLGRDTSVH